jgi:hypothetical protein
VKSWKGQVAFVVAGLLVLVAIAVVQAGRADDRAEADRERVARALEALAPVTLSYYAEGTAITADITVVTPTGMEQSSVTLPLNNKSGTPGLHFEVPRGTYASISVQNRGDTGDVTCRIEVDGTVVSENTSTTDYGIASCNGRS